MATVFTKKCSYYTSKVVMTVTTTFKSGGDMSSPLHTKLRHMPVIGQSLVSIYEQSTDIKFTFSLSSIAVTLYGI